MAKTKKKTINVLGSEIGLITTKDQDYVSLTDIAKGFEGEAKDHLQNWLRNGSTIEYLGEWEQLHNPKFKVVQLHDLKANYTRNSFLMSVKKWVNLTDAIGIMVKYGRYGGTFAHNEIALHFASWLSPKFQVYLLKEFKRLKELEAIENRQTLEWTIKRIISKSNYLIHTEAIKTNLIPKRLTEAKNKDGFIYASEADLLNVSLFGMTAKEWRLQNPNEKGNIRDFATIEQLTVLSNLEAHNAEFIKEGLSQNERLDRLNRIAIEHMAILIQYSKLNQLK